jgi:hypothetical protein
LIVVPAVGGDERHIRTLFLRPGEFLGSPPLAWTPQSDGLVFTTRLSDDSAGAHHIYRLTLATGELVPLTGGDDVYDTSPAISPDGRWLAFVRHPDFGAHLRGTLIVQPLGDDAEAREPIVVPVTSAEETIGDAVHSPSWSADSRRLTFVAGVEVLEWEVGAAQARLVYVGTGFLGGISTAGDISALAMVRDGIRARAVIAGIRSTGDIFALPLAPATHEATGLPLTRIASSAGEAHPRFSPDGRRIVFVSRMEGRADIFVAAADGSEPARLTSMEARIVGYPRWSPDGKRIAFHSQVGAEREVFIVDPAGGPPQRLAAGCCVDWSPDGEYLYAMDIAESQTLARIRAADGQREQLFNGGFPTVTADGSRLLYGKLGERVIYSRPIDGDIRSNAEQMLVMDAAYPAGIAATVDGFFYVGDAPDGLSPHVRFYDDETRTARTVARIPGRSVEMLSVSPDGSELLYASQAESGADLVLVEFGGPWR